MRHRSRGTATIVEGMLEHESRRIPYRLHLRHRNGLRISVTPELEVKVFAPQRASRGWIESAIQERANWIAKTLDRVAACEILTIPKSYSGGESVWYAGRPYRLALCEGKTRAPDLILDAVVVTLPDPSDGHTVGRVIRRWYRRQAEIHYREAVTRCLPPLRNYGVRTPEIRIRDMRSRWGSCSSDGRVTLNLKLVMLPERAVDYVVMHELCHLVHHNHSKRYYALLSTCMPDWKERRLMLRRYRIV